jgi:hypothetical protein
MYYTSGKGINTYNILEGKPQEIDKFRDLGVGRTIILHWILEAQYVKE